jgi:type 2 lantibiotic biosynthesis protein LanM
MLVDLETLFHPDFMSHAATPEDDEQYRFLRSRTLDSLQRIAMLPSHHLPREGSTGIDMSGIGGGAEQEAPLNVPTLSLEAPDDIQIRLQPARLPSRNNRPVFEGRALEAHSHADEIVGGFRAMCDLFARSREEFLATDGPLAIFEDEPIRVIIRPTAQYSVLLNSLMRPDIVVDGIVTDLHLDRFLTVTDNWKAPDVICSAERLDIWRRDIPLFYSKTDSVDLRTSSGRIVKDFFAVSGIDVARRRLERLFEIGSEALAWEVATSLSMAVANAHPGLNEPVQRVALRTDPKLTGEDTPSQDAARHLACALGERILQLGVFGPDDPSWMGVLETDMNLSLQVMGPDLYGGLAGTSLFLAYLGEVSGEPRFTDTAQRTLRTVRRLVEYSSDSWNMGAFKGLGGYIYSLLHFGSLWHDPGLQDEASAYLPAMQDLLPADDSYDVIGGVAGAIPILLALHAWHPATGALGVAEQCGRHLVATATPQEEGIGWALAGHGGTPLTGFGHGAAGGACALMMLWGATGEAAFHDTAIRALTYERSLFNAAKRGWPDLREMDGGDTVGGRDRYRFSAWCHGAAGIGLSRCRIARWLPGDAAITAEIRAAVDLTIETGLGSNHSLCHGDLGNRELLEEAAEVLADPQLKLLSQQVSKRIITDIAVSGYKTGVRLGIDTPDLMRGAAGIGLGLLRIAAPEVVPSIMMLDPPVATTRQSTSRPVRI